MSSSWTYALLCVPFLAVVLGVAVIVALRSRKRQPGWWRAHALALALTLAGMVLLTAVFDSLMIAAGLVGYDPALRTGMVIGRAPVEDFAYPLAAVIGLPALWQWWGRRPHVFPLTRYTWRIVLSSRPISWINTAYPFGAAYLLATGGLDAVAIVGVVFFLIPYNLLMYGVNDVFDYDSDLHNPRKGGMEGVLLEQHLHRATLITAVALATPFVGYLMWRGNLSANVVLAASMAAVVGYSAPKIRLKERPFADSATSSFHFVSPALYGCALAGALDGWRVWVALGAYFAWGMASHAFGAVQDVPADRAGGINSIATELGAAATVRFSLGMYAVAGLALLSLGWWGAVVALLVIPYVWLAAPYRSVSDEAAPTAHAGWRRFLVVNYLVGFAFTQVLIAWSRTS